MANAIKWSALGTLTTVINGADAAPTLKNLANNGQKLGAEVDNATDRNMYADFELLCKFQSAPSAGGYVALYLVQAVDGTEVLPVADAYATLARTR